MKNENMNAASTSLTCRQHPAGVRFHPPGRSACPLESANQFTHGHSKGLGHSDQRSKREVFFATLDPAEEIVVQVRFFREPLQSKARALPAFPDRGPKNNAVIGDFRHSLSAQQSCLRCSTPLNGLFPFFFLHSSALLLSSVLVRTPVEEKSAGTAPEKPRRLFMKKILRLLSLIALILSVCLPSTAQTLDPLSAAPAVGTFYFATGGPPFPFDPSIGQLPVYEWTPGVYVVDDSGGSWASGVQAQLLGNGGGGVMVLSGLPTPCNPCPTNSAPGGPGDWGGPAYNHSSNDLWLEIASVVMSNSTATFVIHTPETNGVYDLFGTTNMALTAAGLNQTNWVRLMRTAAGQTNLSTNNIWPVQGWFQLGKTNDLDNDGLTTAFEFLVSHTVDANGLDTSVDYDGDGIGDGVEVQYQLNPLVPDPPFTITISQPSPLLP